MHMDALRQAVLRNDLAEVKAVLGKYPYLFHAKCEADWPVMHVCVDRNLADLKLLKMYVANGGDVGARAGSGSSLLLLGKLKSLPQDCVAFLEANGARLTVYEEAVFALSSALEPEEHDERILALMKREPSVVRQVGPDGFTLLHRAVQVVSPAVLKKIIKNGADVNALTHTGVSVMGWTNDEEVEVRKILLKAGARFTREEHLSELIMRGETLPVIEAVEADKRLLHAWVPVLRIPLSLVCVKFGKDPMFFEYFLKKGVSIGVTDDEGNTALHLHASKSKPNRDFLALLLDWNAVVNVEDERGYTPLHYAVTGNEETAFFLIENGANINARACSGETPLDFVYQFKLVGFGQFGARLKKLGAVKSAEL